MVGTSIGAATMEEYVGSLKIYHRELPYDPVIPLLDVYLKRTIIRNYACTQTLKTALFMIAKTWEQPRCPPTEE